MKIGIEGVLNYKAAGIATGDWVLVPHAQDITLTLGTTEATSTARGTGRVQAVRTVAKTISLTFTTEWTGTNTALQSFLDAYLDHSMRGIQSIDSNGFGFQFDGVVTDFVHNAPIEGQAETVTVTLKATRSESAPSKVSPS